MTACRVATRVYALADLKTSTAGDHDGEALVRPHDLHSHHSRAALAGADRPGLHASLLGATLESDWQCGSTYRWLQNGATIADSDQVVLESEPYRRLSYSWHTFTSEWAKATGFGEDYRAKAASEPRSKVTFDIEPIGETVSLTVMHDGFEPGSAVLDGISKGWPRILSKLKTLLETGDPPVVLRT